MKEWHFLSLAKKISEKSSHHSHALGCVITRGNRILGQGFNTLKTHPDSPHPWRTVHAEFAAVLAANYDVRDAVVYIFRQQKNGTPAISKPCKFCWDFLMSQGVKKVVYTCEGSFKEEMVA